MYCIEEAPEIHKGTIEMKDENGNVRKYNASSWFEKQLFTKIKKGFSPTIVICGERRIGKSLLGLWVARQYCKFMGKKFDRERHTFYDSMDARSNMNKWCYEPMIIDEAADLLDTQEYYTKQQRALKSMLNVQAWRGLLYIFLSPFILDISAHIRRHFDFNLYVTARGRFKAYRYIKNFRATEQKKASWPFFLDDLGIKKTDLPKGAFEAYEKHSFEQKDLIAKKREAIAQDEVNPMIAKMMKQERYKYGKG